MKKILFKNYVSNKQLEKGYQELEHAGLQLVTEMRDIHARLKQRHHLGQYEKQRPGLAFFSVPREHLRGLLLDLRDTPALFFKNAGTGRHNMVYRRADGSIGWVEPR